MSKRTWTEAEARALVGKRVRTTIEFSGVPAGTEATITRADPGSDGWTVGLTWDLEDHKGPGRKPLTDWFTRDEYERWIEEL